ncbi:hypothetical protein F4861DRAFT_321970 [Xylaria intraflava]|nr:hypothetical protein F4861DRAFT_321970 [Xylaria intraflava]
MGNSPSSCWLATPCGQPACVNSGIPERHFRGVTDRIGLAVSLVTVRGLGGGFQYNALTSHFHRAGAGLLYMIPWKRDPARVSSRSCRVPRARWNKFFFPITRIWALMCEVWSRQNRKACLTTYYNCPIELQPPRSSQPLMPSLLTQHCVMTSSKLLGGGMSSWPELGSRGIQNGRQIHLWLPHRNQHGRNAMPLDCDSSSLTYLFERRVRIFTVVRTGHRLAGYFRSSN